MSNITPTTFYVLISRGNKDEEAKCRKFKCGDLASKQRLALLAEMRAATGLPGQQEGCTCYFGECTYVYFERQDFGKEVEDADDPGWVEPCWDLECHSLRCEVERPAARMAGIEQLVREMDGAVSWDVAAAMYDEQFICN
jgi:hypothetical protein